MVKTRLLQQNFVLGKIFFTFSILVINHNEAVNTADIQANESHTQ